jgi:pimeloyl-ACP methyl ester carboxylesterase
LDRPGCGASEPFFYWDEQNLRAHAVAVLRGVLDAFHIDRAGFVANSMGGLWSLWTARDAPDRVSGLVLPGVPALFLDTSAPFPMRLASIPWIGRRMLRLNPGTPEQAAGVMRRLGHRDAQRIGADFLDLMATASKMHHLSDSFASLLHHVLWLGGARIHFAADEWTRLEAPVHLLWGDRDPFGGVATARRAVELRPETRLDIVPQGGHLPWYDDVDAVAAAITSMFGGSSDQRSVRRTSRGLDPTAERNTRAM